MRFHLKTHRFLIRFHLATTLQRSKTEVFVFGNGDIWKRFWIRRHLKTHRYILMWLHENRAFQKRCCQMMHCCRPELPKKTTCIYGTNITTWFNSTTKQLGISLLLMPNFFRKFLYRAGFNWKLPKTLDNSFISYKTSKSSKFSK